MSSGLLGISTSGLLTAQKQLSTTGHNISNVNTDGYARQKTETTNRIPQYSGAGYIGTGVEASTTRRYYDEFLEDQIRTSNNQLGRFSRYYELSSQIDNILANPDAGLTPTVEAFFNALQEANDYPSSIPARSVLLTSANTMVDRFGLLQQRFVDLNEQTNSKISDVVSEITSRADSIAQLNTKIISQIGAGNGDLPNDTMDKREQLIKEISERIAVNVVYDDNGAANVFVGSGQVLVLGSDAYEMRVADSEYTPGDKRIYIRNANVDSDVSSYIKGGELQGLMDFKTEVLESSFNSMGRIAASLTKEINEQHALGMTLRLNNDNQYVLGGDFFTDITTSQNALDSKNNAGTSVLSFEITDTSVLTTSDYELKIDVGGNYNMTRLSDNVSITGANIAAINTLLLDPTSNFGASQGIQLNMTAGVVNGDKFLIRPTHDLSRGIQTKVNDVLDIALANPLIASQMTDTLGVGVNTGTGGINLLPFNASTIDRVNDVDANNNPVNIPITDGGAPPTDIDFVLRYTGAGFTISTTARPATAPAPFPATAANPPLGTFTVEKVNGGATTYSVADSGETYKLSDPAYDHISFTLTGEPQTGDYFIISNNKAPQDDNRNGLTMADLQTKKTLQNGEADFQSAYGLMVANVGTRTHSAEIDEQAQVTLNDLAKQNRDTLSGVNLDEEASNLLRFQQAYQASARVISVSDEIFNTLINAM